MRLIIVRHGETRENALKIVYGHLPGELTDKGIEQAKKTGQLLSNEHIDAVLSSDLKRCVDTSRIISSYINACPIQFTVSLREQQQDSLNGKKVDDVDWDNLPPDVENDDQMLARGKKILSETYQRYPDKTVLFVTHKRFENILINILLKRKASDRTELENVLNSSVSIFEVNEDLEGDPAMKHSVDHI